jgi:ribosomal protein L4
VEKLYTTEEIAKLLHMTNVRSVTAFLKREGIGRKIGRRVFVKASELEKLFSRNRPAPETK